MIGVRVNILVRVRARVRHCSKIDLFTSYQ